MTNSLLLYNCYYQNKMNKVQITFPILWTSFPVTVIRYPNWSRHACEIISRGGHFNCKVAHISMSSDANGFCPLSPLLAKNCRQPCTQLWRMLAVYMSSLFHTHSVHHNKTKKPWFKRYVVCLAPIPRTSRCRMTRNIYMYQVTAFFVMTHGVTLIL